MDDARCDAHGYGGDARSRAARLWQGAADGAVPDLSGAEERLGASASVFHRSAEANGRAASCWSALGFRLASSPSVVDQSGDLSGRTDDIGRPSASSNRQSVDLDRQSAGFDRQTAAADEASSFANQ